MKLTLDFFEKRDIIGNRCDFLVNNNLIGFPSDKINDIKGDYEYFVPWLKGLVPQKECVKEYNSNGKCIYYNNSITEYWVEYDDNDRLKHIKFKNGNEEWYDYDDCGNLVHSQTNYGYECWFETKENSQYVRDCNGREFWYEFDCNKNITYHKDSHPQGEEYWQEYDVNNNRIFYRNSYGFEKRCEYDANNNLIHSKNSDGFEKWYEYDSHNNLVCWRNSDGEEGHNHIEYYDDGQLKKLNELEIPWFEKEVM